MTHAGQPELLTKLNLTAAQLTAHKQELETYVLNLTTKIEDLTTMLGEAQTIQEAVIATASGPSSTNASLAKMLDSNIETLALAAENTLDYWDKANDAMASLGSTLYKFSASWE